MIWVGALQKTGTFSRLEPHGKDVRVVTVYTHTFVMGGQDGLADDREDPFYTASGSTPEEAEARAREVYLKVVCCSHRMQRKAPMLLECGICGVQQRTNLAKEVPDAKSAPKKAAQSGSEKAGKAGFFGWLRTA